MPVINGVYLKDFTALPGAVADANIIPIAISGDNIAYRTTVAGIVTDARVTSKLLTGLSVTGGTIVSTDTILQAFGKVQNQINSKVTSVGLSMPSAFTVTNSPVTGSGTLTVTGAGLASQYIRGDGALADFPTGGTGGGSSVSYYLNGSVNQGTFVGNTYYEMNKTPVFGAGTDFNIAADGYIAQFITDANDPNVLLIPAGNWNLETYFSASSSGGTPTFYMELYKYNGSTFTLIASNSTNPELIAFGTTVAPYFSTLAVPETVLLATDRLAIRVYVANSGRTITLHTENSNLCQIITTFTTGLQALNGLTKQTQYFAVGTSGNDFNISSSNDTHTFNIPNADSSARGIVSTGTQSFAGVKTFLNNIKSNDQFYIREQNALNLLANYTQVQANNTYFAFTNGAGTGSATFTYNGSYNYTLPAATGTIALVGGPGIGSVTSVAALTLGTSGTDLSSTVANSTTTPVITLNVPDASATARGVITAGTQTIGGFKTFNSTLTISNGTSHALSLEIGTSGNTASLKAPATGSSVVITLPAASGTVALTSDLSAYLPLSGGTLTGALSGTSATFSGTGTFGTLNSATIPLIGYASTSNIGLKLIGTSTGNGNGTYFYANNGSTLLGSVNIAGTAMAITNEQAGILYFATSGSEQARISTSGDFSIGTSSGGYKLNVNGTGNFSGALTGTSASFSSTATATAFIPSGASVPTNGMYLSGTNTLDFSTNSTNRLSITSGGNVGIGTASPSSGAGWTPKLVLEGTSSAIIIKGVNSQEVSIGSSAGMYIDALGCTVGTDNNIIFRNTNTNSSFGASERMRITSGGEVYIAGTTDQGAYNLQVNGTGVWGAGAYVNGSDLRLKEDIKPILSGLDYVNKMNPVSFKYLESYSRDRSIQTGFIAQELKEVFKDEEWVEGIVQKGANHYNVAYQNIIPILVKSIQELTARIIQLENN